MLNLLQSIFRGASVRTGPDEDLIRAATERVVDGTEPRLRAVGRYRKVLREPVARAVAHVIALVDSLPEPVEISRHRFADNPLLRAFFVSADHLQEVVSYGTDLRQYLQSAAPTPSASINCLLTLDRSEKSVLGMALRGDAVSRDVAQRVVTFSGHRLVGFAESAAETCWELKKRAFDHLIQTALQNLTNARDQNQMLARQQRLLKKKLTAMGAANWGMTSILQPDPAADAAEAAAAPGASAHADAMPNDTATIERQLAAIEQELATLPIDPATLEGQLAGIAATLNAPELCLRLEHNSLTLDPMGVRLKGGRLKGGRLKGDRLEGGQLEGRAADGVTALELTELVSGDLRRIALPGYVLRAELLPPRNFLEEAQRRLQGGR